MSSTKPPNMHEYHKLHILPNEQKLPAIPTKKSYFETIKQKIDNCARTIFPSLVDKYETYSLKNKNISSEIKGLDHLIERLKLFVEVFFFPKTDLPEVEEDEVSEYSGLPPKIGEEEESPYASLPKREDIRSLESAFPQSEPSTPQSPLLFSSKEELIKPPVVSIQIKKELGAGAVKTVYELRKNKEFTKKLLKNIKLHNSIIPQSKLNHTADVLKKINRTQLSPEVKNAFEQILEEIPKYAHMSLKEKGLFTKKLNQLLHKITILSEKDIGLIVVRNREFLSRSLGNRQKRLESLEDPHQQTQLREDIKQLEFLLSFGRDGASISNAYAQLPAEQKVQISQFLTVYLKDKRARVTYGEVNNEGLDNFQNEVKAINSLRKTLRALDQEIENLPPEESLHKEKLLQVRDFTKNIAIPDLTSEETGTYAKKYKLGDLKKITSSNPQLISSQEMLKGLASVAEGVAALHALGYVHRDIALRNIFVTDQMTFVPSTDGNQIEKQYHLRFAISDFGRMLDLGDKPYIQFDLSDNHPIKWLAPEEILMAQASQAGDVYSFGITLLEALLGKKAFNECLNEKRKDPGNTSLEKDYVFRVFSDYCKKNKLSVDPSIEKLIFFCLSDKVGERPSMFEIAEFMEKLHKAQIPFTLKPNQK